ncbi:MAG: DUF167 domain-containing protein [Desulforegulaceae bacterium]|nr:DUF167 domain-containing protein [Desulforegulaceae bacterium]
MDELPLKIKDDNFIINLHVQPKASRNEASGIYNNAFKVKIKAPPVDGAANKECIKFLSKSLKIPKTSISIVSGETGRNKKLSINKPKNQTIKEFKEKILAFLK